ncbi:MAG TPA: hypothetical protein VMH90_07195, partial [Thermoplasmata archaeon]|nr:hypothetical protein [Thermoplasmata archaeon]
SVLAVLGVLMVSGTVLADVVLSFTANNGVGANAASPFVFQNGANYAAANGLGVATNAYTSGTNGPTVTTTINGINGVLVAEFDVTEFATATTLGATGTPSNVVVPGASTLTPVNVVCAYAFVSTAKPSLGTTAVSGAPAGCSATVPALGTVSTGCGGTATAQVATVNLLTGTVAGTIGTSGCAVAKSTVSGVVVLYVSYAIQTNGVVTATSLNAFQVPVTLQ